MDDRLKSQAPTVLEFNQKVSGIVLKPYHFGIDPSEEEVARRVYAKAEAEFKQYEEELAQRRPWYYGRKKKSQRGRTPFEPPFHGRRLQKRKSGSK